MGLLDGIVAPINETLLISKASAEFSEDGRYRYSLTREWDDPAKPGVLWIMLNPSTADGVVDDPTIRRCTDFSRQWGFGHMTVVNLFALRSTNPDALYTAADPIGPENDRYILRAAIPSIITVVAWGAHGAFMDRGQYVKDFIWRKARRAVFHLGFTAEGHPRHPLYLPKDTKPEVW